MWCWIAFGCGMAVNLFYAILLSVLFNRVP